MLQNDFCFLFDTSVAAAQPSEYLYNPSVADGQQLIYFLVIRKLLHIDFVNLVALPERRNHNHRHYARKAFLLINFTALEEKRHGSECVQISI